MNEDQKHMGFDPMLLYLCKYKLCNLYHMCKCQKVKNRLNQ